MKKKVLVIDDEVSLTSLLKMNIENSGDYEVMAINDPTKGLAAAIDMVPHLILLDLDMPGLHGAELARMIEADPQLADVPIVFLTARAGFVNTGDLAVMEKPVSLEQILDCIDQHAPG